MYKQIAILAIFAIIAVSVASATVGGFSAGVRFASPYYSSYPYGYRSYSTGYVPAYQPNYYQPYYQNYYGPAYGVPAYSSYYPYASRA